LLSQVSPNGHAMARDLERLLAVKDDAHYGMLHLSHQRAVSALRQARRLVDAVSAHVR